MGSMGDYGQYNTSAVPASVDIMGFSCRCHSLFCSALLCWAQPSRARVHASPVGKPEGSLQSACT